MNNPIHTIFQLGPKNDQNTTDTIIMDEQMTSFDTVILDKEDFEKAKEIEIIHINTFIS